jgi:hypothetical protein
MFSPPPPPPRFISEPTVTKVEKPQISFLQAQSVLGSPLYGEMSLCQQAIKVDWVEKVNLVDNYKFRLPGSQSILCGLDLGNQKLAFGFKDGTIQIVTNEGQPIATLK